MSSLSPKDRVSLCMFTYADGRRCRTPRISSHPHFCCDHAQKESRAATADKLGKTSPPSSPATASTDQRSASRQPETPSRQPTPRPLLHPIRPHPPPHRTQKSLLESTTYNKPTYLLILGDLPPH
jgi:hypothetical protein